MTTNQQNNSGQTQINSARETFNSKVSRLSMMGKTKKVQWDGRRRNRSI
jgi:hypothetical protein